MGCTEARATSRTSAPRARARLAADYAGRTAQPTGLQAATNVPPRHLRPAALTPRVRLRHSGALGVAMDLTSPSVINAASGALSGAPPRLIAHAWSSLCNVAARADVTTAQGAPSVQLARNQSLNAACLANLQAQAV